MVRRRIYRVLLAYNTGQGLVEYGMILVLIAVACVGILTLVGQTVSGLWYQRIVEGLDEVLN
nr:MAG: Flp family type IVb pilin [Chloroflexota bacterium]